MAQNELLPFLKLLLFIIVTINSNTIILANSLSKAMSNLDSDAVSFTETELLQKLKDLRPTNEQLNWSKDVKKAGQIITKNAILQKLGELNVYQNGQELGDNKFVYPKAIVKVFVSNSMPKNLLCQYHKQVTQYGGTLVFKGLPGGSFKTLAKLVMAIAENGEVGSMQIDDEAFDYFAISAVPVILLIKEEDCLSNQSCTVTYDKLTGSVSVKLALEKFAQNGDLSEEAKRLLEK